MDLSYHPWMIRTPEIELSVLGTIRKRDAFMIAAQQFALFQIYLLYPQYIHVYREGPSVYSSASALHLNYTRPEARTKA